MKRPSPLVLSALAAFALAGCATGPLGASASELRVESVASAISQVAASATNAATSAPPSSASLLTETPIDIVLGPTVTAGAGVSINGATVTIEQPGTYRVTGALADGQLLVNAPEDVDITVVLDGARISSSTGAPLSVLSDTDLTLILADGSENSLSDAATYQLPAGADEPNGALFGKGDLTIAGNGALTIDATFQHGIRGKDDVAIDGGAITITSKGDAVNSNNDLTLNGGQLRISAGDDGLHADLKLTINDGIVQIDRSYEGIESEQIILNGGQVSLTAADDGINVAGGVDGSATGFRPSPGAAAASNRLLTVNGGSFVVNATGDGIDVNGSWVMTGGEIVVHGPTANMNAALDYDGTFKLTGGNVIAAGSAGMAQAPGTTSTQNSVMVNLPAAQPAGTPLRIASASGAELLSFTPTKAAQTLVWSSPALKQGETYVVYVANAEFARFTVNGVVTNAGVARATGPGMRAPR